MSRRQAEQEARELRQELARRDSSAVQLPIDPVRIANVLGIDVFVANMRANVSGTLQKKQGEDPIIYLNRTDSDNRQRFTCAHELGHYVRRTADGDADYDFVDARDQLASMGTHPEEVYANQFAAALLMPADLVRLEHRRGLGPVRLAVRFGVSDDAMGYRLKTLGLSG